MDDGPSQSRQTVLVVEDSAAMRDLVQQVLEGAGYRALLASTCAEALAVWESEGAAVDLLLTDLVLPDRSGTDLADHLIGDSPHLRVLVMSGYDDQEIPDGESWRTRGGSIRKPFDVGELTRRVDELIARG